MFILLSSLQLLLIFRFKFKFKQPTNKQTIILLIFHEKIATNIDSIIMPNSAELCKTISANLSKNFFLF